MTWPRHADGLSSQFEHGEHYPERGGYYDSSRQAFVSSPPKTVTSSPTRSRTLNDNAWRDAPIPREERIATSQADGWKPSPHHEQLRRLRDSDRPEDRATYNAMDPGQRVALGYYEQGLAAHVAAGRELPDGVAPPKD